MKSILILVFSCFLTQIFMQGDHFDILEESSFLEIQLQAVENYYESSQFDEAKIIIIPILQQYKYHIYDKTRPHGFYITNENLEKNVSIERILLHYNSIVATFYALLGRTYFYGASGHSLSDENINLEKAYKNYYLSSIFGKPESLYMLGFMQENYLFTELAPSPEEIETAYHPTSHSLINMTSFLNPFLNYNTTSHTSELDFNSLHSPIEKGASALKFISLVNSMSHLNYQFSSLQDHTGATMSLGYKHKIGSGVDKSCIISSKYYIKASKEALEDLADYQKLNYIGLIERKRLHIANNPHFQIPHIDPMEEEILINNLLDKAYFQNHTLYNKLGHIYWNKKKDLRSAYQTFWQDYSLNKNYQSLYYLGYLHLFGLQNISLNYEKAFKYFESCANMTNFSKCMNSLGYMYKNGLYVEKNYTIAYDYFLKAAKLEDYDAIFNLASFLMEAGIEKLNFTLDYNLAFKEFIKAAKSGHTLASYNVGMMSLMGIGAPMDCEIGVGYLKYVSDKGIYSANFSEAYKYYSEGNVKLAALIYMQLAEMGSQIAQFNAANILDSDDIFINEPFMIHNYQTQILQLIHKSQYNQSTLPNFKLEQFLALKFFKMADQEGEILHKNRLGDYYFYGIATQKNIEKAKDYYSQAASTYDELHLQKEGLFNYEDGAYGEKSEINSQNALGNFNLALMNHFGMEVQKNKDRAKVYYENSIHAASEAYIPAYLMLILLDLQELNFSRILKMGFDLFHPYFIGIVVTLTLICTLYLRKFLKRQE